MARRIKPLDTPESCRKECEQLYRRAWKGEIAWGDVHEAAAVLERLSSMIPTNGDQEQGEAKWQDVAKNALRR